VSGALDELRRHGVLSPLDYHFASMLARIEPAATETVLLGAAFASRAIGRGDVCADLAKLGGTLLHGADEAPIEPALPPAEVWRSALAESALVSDGSTLTPLVLSGPRLYLHRYFEYEQKLASALRARAKLTEAVDEQLLRADVDRLFPNPEDTGTGPQRRAALTAVRRRFAVISGGPGTGKTFTVVKILALLQSQALARSGEPLDVLLVAPTGKAAQRLGESIEQQRELVGANLASHLPARASTIQRALGYQPRTPSRFRHNAQNPLVADVVIVDEASMVALALMSKLVDAVPPTARLILLGDKDQLASVEAGSILGDLYPADRLAAVPAGAATPEIRACLAELTTSFRYPPGSGIERLARFINLGDAAGALALLRPSPRASPRRRRAPSAQLGLPFAAGAEPQAAAPVASPPHAADIALVEPASAEALAAALTPRVLEGFTPFCRETEPSQKLLRLGAFRVLCALRRGPFGAEALNRVVEQQLAEARLLRPDGEAYDGRPIIVTRNDYQLGLFNGDVGVIMHGADGVPLCHFVDQDGRLRSLPPGRLPPHETVFAMTVHKSQGSEFARIALVLPERISPVATRELLYTGITRARQRAELFARGEVLQAAIERRTERASGLREAIWR
jgi:exodeoxyribonuclease V alpha subunit